MPKGRVSPVLAADWFRQYKRSSESVDPCLKPGTVASHGRAQPDERDFPAHRPRRRKSAGDAPASG